ncbi:MAG TPA: prolyl oligopeptidase family serine peptidase [Croceibacterium sp.]
MLRLAAFALLSVATAQAASARSPEAGFEQIATTDGIELGVWYPTSGTPSLAPIGLTSQTVVVGTGPEPGAHPLVVMSHGTGGDFAGHADTAVALARAGFVVAALTHPGDNWRDNSRATRVEERPAALGVLITWMLASWSGRATIDPERIGAFGFSAGGFTVLAAAGGRPELSRVADYCAGHPETFVCTLVRSAPLRSAEPWPEAADARIKAIVVAAPAVGFAFDRAGLSPVRVPVQLWRADDDQILPAPDYADAVAAALPRPAEFHAMPDAGHFDFLAPCRDPSTAPDLCGSAAGFDRVAFHDRFNAEIVRFFSAELAAP